MVDRPPRRQPVGELLPGIDRDLQLGSCPRRTAEPLDAGRLDVGSR